MNEEVLESAEYVCESKFTSPLINGEVNLDLTQG